MTDDAHTDIAPSTYAVTVDTAVGITTTITLASSKALEIDVTVKRLDRARNWRRFVALSGSARQQEVETLIQGFDHEYTITFQ